ncbi:hypothetical protein CDIK_2601 [Cucumispora dikerogammari]|nr:hypothetical protein CDIK_2601 [Cucumispora dikerogammari]
MFALYMTYFFKLISSYSNDEGLPYLELSTMSALAQIPASGVCTYPEQIYNAVMKSIHQGVPINAMITKKNVIDPDFKATDVLEILKPIEINGLFYNFQPNKKTLTYMNTNDTFLVISNALKDPIRIDLILPPNYVFVPLEIPGPPPPPPAPPADTSKTVTPSGITAAAAPAPNTPIDGTTVYSIPYAAPTSTTPHENTIFVENLPIFSISYEVDPALATNTLVHIAECNNAAETIKGIPLVYGKDAAGVDLTITVDYTKKYCPAQYLIKIALIDDVILEAKKLAHIVDKKIEEGLAGAIQVLKNKKVRLNLVESSKKCSVKPGCICKNKCQTKTSCIEKVCPTTPMECLKYCLQSTVSCFLAMECAWKVCPDVSWSSICYPAANYEKPSIPCGGQQIQSIQSGKTASLKMLFSMIYKCNSIFEVRVLLAMYLSSCIQTNGSISGNMFFDCQYDMLMCSYDEYLKQKNQEMNAQVLDETAGEITDLECNAEGVAESADEDEIVNDSDAAESSSENENKKKNSSKVWMWVSVSIAVVAVVAVGGYFLIA